MRGHLRDIPDREDPGSVASAEFRQEVNRILHNLYNPAELRQSSLMDWYRIRSSVDAPASLRKILFDAIESLKPGSTLTESKAWLFYQVLHYRFYENIPQKEVARSLSRSIRQIRRIENQAIEQLVDILWNQIPSLPPVVAMQSAGKEDESRQSLESSEMPSMAQEMSLIDQSSLSETIQIRKLVEGIYETLTPIARRLSVELILQNKDASAMISVKVNPLRQGILTLLVPLLSAMRGGELEASIETADDLHTGTLRFIAIPGEEEANMPAIKHEDTASFAQLLIASSGGSLRLSEEASGTDAIHITLPILPAFRVLAIDDNADVLQLMQRYTANTRYSLFILKDPLDFPNAVKEFMPQVIILDVMMGNIDGWELLGRLRQHPLTNMIPVLICTILPHEALAHELGAAGFLQKPVSRKALLEALDHQAYRLESGFQ